MARSEMKSIVSTNIYSLFGFVLFYLFLSFCFFRLYEAIRTINKQFLLTVVVSYTTTVVAFVNSLRNISSRSRVVLYMLLFQLLHDIGPRFYQPSATFFNFYQI